MELIDSEHWKKKRKKAAQRQSPRMSIIKHLNYLNIISGDASKVIESLS